MKVIAIAIIITVLGAVVPAMDMTYAQSNIRIDAAGATFAFPLLDLWRVEYASVEPDIRFSYTSIGSGGGVKNHIEETINFGATEAPLTDAESEHVPGTITIPAMIGAISIAYNVVDGEGNPIKGINLTEEALCGMFLKEITNWSDPAIKEANENIDLPDADIVTVHRSDGSGTTFAFTSYLTKTCPAWDERVGAAKSVPWPTGIGSPGNEGVANAVRSTDNTVGYITLAYAIENDITVANIQNGDHTEFVTPSLETASLASGSAAFWLPAAQDSWYGVDLLAVSGASSYPITSFSYLIVHPDLDQVNSIKSKEHAQAVVDMIAWMITDGQQHSSKLQYVPIADTVSNIGLKGLSQIMYDGKPLYTGPTNVWGNTTNAAELDDFIMELYADYNSDDLDQSTFLNLMSKAAELHDMVDNDLIDNDRLAEALENIRP